MSFVLGVGLVLPLVLVRDKLYVIINEARCDSELTDSIQDHSADYMLRSPSHRILVYRPRVSFLNYKFPHSRVNAEIDKRCAVLLVRRRNEVTS